MITMAIDTSFIRGLKTKTIAKVPTWAVSYLEYNDDSGLNKYDKELVDDWLKDLKKKGLRLICPDEGSESEFEHNPAFGVATSTVDYIAEVLPKEYDLVFTETLICHLSVKAHSRREAIAKANQILNDGIDGWDSLGQKLKSCKPAAEGVA